MNEMQLKDLTVADIFRTEQMQDMSVTEEADMPLTRVYDGVEADAVDVYKYLWRSFADDIASDKYKVFPTMTEFRRWLVRQSGKNNTKRMSAFAEAYINRYFPRCTAWVKALQADIINEGAAKKCYDKTAAIFALKNICGWSDSNKPETTTGSPIQINISVLK